MLRRAILTLFVSLPLLTTSCLPDASEEGKDQQSGHGDLTPAGLTIERAHFSNLAAIRPDNPASPAAVTGDGVLVVAGVFDEAQRWLLTADSTGRVLARFARRGQGPGEVMHVGQLFAGAEGVTVWDGSQQRLVRFTVLGQHVWTTGAIGEGQPLLLGRDSMDFLIWGPGKTEVRRYGLPSLGWRDLIPADDSVLRRFAATPEARGFVGFASIEDGMVIVNPVTYEMQYYDPQGRRNGRHQREVAQRFRTQQELLHLQQSIRRGFVGADGIRRDFDTKAVVQRAAERPVRHFTTGTGPVAVSDLLWLVGGGSDSTFVDLFQHRTFVRRWMLPCSNTWPTAAITRTRILLVCEVTDSLGDRVGEIQVYRIRRADPTG